LIGARALVRPLRLLVGCAVALSVVAFLASAAAACTCAGSARPGAVVFTGTVVDTPEDFALELFSGSAGVFTFDIESVTRGDPGDGRVFTGYGFGGCGWTYQLGATYLVHAAIVEPDGEWLGLRPGVPLATDSCMQGAQVAPAWPGSVIGAWLGRPPVALGAVGVLMALAAVYLVVRGRQRHATTPSEEPHRPTGA
jgi:hypothetical protein